MIMLFEVYFVKHYYLFFKVNKFSLMSQKRQAPTTIVISKLDKKGGKSCKFNVPFITMLIMENMAVPINI